MPKLNAVLMVLLSAAVIGGLGWRIVGRGDDGAVARERSARLLRKLADNDPDLRREAEAEIKALGEPARELLREAAKASDVRLAGRAAALLRSFEPEAPLPPAAVPDTLLAVTEGWAVEFRNAGGAPLLIALEKKGEEGRFGGFEVEDASGRVHKIAVPSYAPPVVDGPAHLVALPPGGRQVLYHGEETMDVLLRGLPGPCKVRFVYDAAEGSPYREVAKVSDRGVPLKPGRYSAPAPQSE